MGKDLNANVDITVSPAADGDGQPADGKSADKAVIKYLQYKNDPDATVDLSLSGSNGRFDDGQTTKSNVPLSDGSVTVPFYSTAPGRVMLSAYLASDHKTYGYYNFHFAPAVKKVDREVVPGYGTAPPDGSTPDKVKATVYGYDNSGLADIPVTFQSSDPQADLSPGQPEKTQSDGTAVVSIRNKAAGDVTMMATAGNVPSNPVTVHFSGSAPTVKSVALDVDPTTAPADGKTAMLSTAVVTMSNGSLAPDDTQVIFAATNGATADPTLALTSGGIATAQITSGTVGASSVTATSGAVTSTPVPVQFSSSAPTVKAVGLTLATRTAPADGKTAIRTRAVITMSDGRAAPDGTQVVFTLSNDAAADPSPASTAAGIATTWIASTTVGESDVTASVGSVSSPPAAVQFTAPVKVQTIGLKIDPQTAPADGVTPLTGTATVTMSDKSPAPDGTPVKFAAGSGAKVDPKLAYTSGGKGQATTKITSDEVGPGRAIASSGDVTSDPAAMEFTAPPLNIKHVSLKALAQTAPADGRTPVTCVASVSIDEHKAPDGTAVTFDATTGATVSPQTAYTYNGDAETQVTNATVTSCFVRATSGDVDSFPVMLQFYLPVQGVGLVIPPQSSPADGKTIVQCAASVVMSDGSQVPDGTPVTFAATNGATPDPEMAKTSGGWVGFSLTSRTIGVSSVTATALEVTSNPVDVTFYPPGQRVTLAPSVNPISYRMHVNEDGKTIEIAHEPGKVKDLQTSPYVFTLVPYDGTLFQLASTAYGELRYLVVGNDGVVSSAPASTDKSSLFQIEDPTGNGIGNGKSLAIRSIANGLYLYTPDAVSVSAGISNLHDKNCWWYQQYV